jgi:hypothetical protein
LSANWDATSVAWDDLDTGWDAIAPPPFFAYGDFLEYLRSSVATATDHDAFLSAVTQGLRPTEPFCVIHAFGPTGALERALDGQAVVLSFYLQVDGVGRQYRDAMWMLDKAVAAIRALPPPSYVADLNVGARSSAFEINSEGLRAVGQRVAVRLTRA